MLAWVVCLILFSFVSVAHAVDIVISGTGPVPTAIAIQSPGTPCAAGSVAVGVDVHTNATPCVTLNKAAVGLDQVDNTSDATKNSATALLTNKQVVDRPLQLSAASGTVAAPNADNADFFYRYDISGAITIPNPTAAIAGNPRDGQTLLFVLRSTTPQQVIWGGNFSSENGVGLLSQTTGDVGGQPQYNLARYRYNGTSLKWATIASLPNTRATTGYNISTTNGSIACEVDKSLSCEVQNTAAAGNFTISPPTSATAPIYNGQKIQYKFKCTNLQTFLWDTIFIDSPNVTKPASCTAGLTPWIMVGAEWSSALSKWQILAVN